MRIFLAGLFTVTCLSALLAAQPAAQQATDDAALLLAGCVQIAHGEVDREKAHVLGEFLVPVRLGKAVQADAVPALTGDLGEVGEEEMELIVFSAVVFAMAWTVRLML